MWFLYFFALLCYEVPMSRFEFKLDNYLWGSEKDDVTASAVIENNGTLVTLSFDVVEKELRRMVTEDHGPVWTDSCVEMFLSADGIHYANFEFSASGALHAAYGEGRHERKKYSEEILKTVRREVTILENNNRRSHWRLKAEIDLAAFELVKELPADVTINLYKCGDGLAKPHFLSAFPIDLPSPDFHRPEFFGKITIS